MSSNRADTHNLKTLNPWFSDVWALNKTFEIRQFDRDFKVGDRLCLHEYGARLINVSPCRSILALVTYLLTWKDFPGLAEGYVAIGIRVLSHYDRYSEGQLDSARAVASAFDAKYIPTALECVDYLDWWYGGYPPHPGMSSDERAALLTTCYQLKGEKQQREYWSNLLRSR